MARSKAGRYDTFVDPVTLGLNAATALTAALTLFLSRLDARRQRLKEIPDLRSSLLIMSESLHCWIRNADTTNFIMQNYMTGNLNVQDAASSLKASYAMQRATSELPLAGIEMMLFGRGSRRGQPSTLNLRSLLNVYGPELLEALDAGIGGRKKLLDDLAEQLPFLSTIKTEALAETLTRLTSTSRELNYASTKLDDYISKHFPIDDA